MEEAGDLNLDKVYGLWVSRDEQDNCVLQFQFL